MVKSLLLYNPTAGRKRERRIVLVEQVASVLRAHGFDLRVECTLEKGSAKLQARDAVDSGVKAIFACGGDGTVHDVLQGIAGTGTALGIIPAGSANALAQELGLAANPLEAARQFRTDRLAVFRTMRVRRDGSPDLLSLCMAGAGPAGLLMYRMLAVNRSRLGRWRYYEHALRLFLTHHFAPFECSLVTADGSVVVKHATSAIIMRVGNLHGLFAGLARGASLGSDSLHVVLVAPPARFTLPLWLALSWLQLGRFHPGVTTVPAGSLSIQSATPLQVDGEWAGRSAMTVTLDGPVQRVFVPPDFAGSASETS